MLNISRNNKFIFWQDIQYDADFNTVNKGCCYSKGKLTGVYIITSLDISCVLTSVDSFQSKVSNYMHDASNTKVNTVKDALCYL